MIATGLDNRGLLYEGAALTLERALAAGGVDVLDEPVNRLFRSGELRCCTPGVLPRAKLAAGNTS